MQRIPSYREACLELGIHPLELPPITYQPGMLSFFNFFGVLNNFLFHQASLADAFVPICI